MTAQVSVRRSADTAFATYFKCHDDLGDFGISGQLSAEEGYFSLGDAVCYGRCSGSVPSPYVSGRLPDVSHAIGREGGRLRLPFDLSEVVTNLQQERYRQPPPGYLERITGARAARNAYYFFRPSLPIAVRKHFQRIRLNGWRSIPFPRWPVDTSVETLMQTAMTLVLKSSGTREVPFIWFWPDGADACVMMTHDVEGQAGAEFCEQVMDLDDSFGIKSSFQVVPEMRNPAATTLVEAIRRRGFEVNLHDLHHDGDLFTDRQRFLELAAQINRHSRELQCDGFRAGAMYREQRWFDAFEFSYEMSVPNGAHLEPQRGGCCTVMPYFVGRVLELPLTTTQDYSLFHILGEYSTALWRQQVQTILRANGLISFITHPDYLRESRARAVYRDLLEYLGRLRAERNVWFAPPSDVDRWWRSRQQMTIVPDGDRWRVDGPDCDRARVAYVRLEGDQVVYSLGEAS